MVFVLAILTYLAFAKQFPWSSPGYQLHATFENATTLRETAPVRIAGVNVGEVTSVEAARASGAEVTFSVDEDGQPIHEDAEAEIRPRLFLEGNFFVDLKPGSPSAAELPDGGTIPYTQTSTAVQLDEVLTALQAPTRKGLQKTLEGFGTALNYEPTRRRRHPRTPTSTARAPASRSTTPSPTARRPAAAPRSCPTPARREPGRPRRVHRRDAHGVRKARPSRGDDLGQLITNFNGFAGALATESENLSRTIARARADAERGRPRRSRDLNDALPPLRALAIVSRARDPGAPGDDRRLRPVARPDGSARSGRRARRPRAPAAQDRPGPRQGQPVAANQLFPETTALSQCSNQVLIPTADARDHGGRQRGHRPAELLRVLLRRSSISPASARASTATARTCACSQAAARCSSTTPTRPAGPATRSTSPPRSRRPQGDPAGAAGLDPALPDGRPVRNNDPAQPQRPGRAQPARPDLVP